jgi:hypothetical protein
MIEGGKMKRKKILAILFLILVMVFPQTAFTEDFTLRVPVILSNLHNQVSAINVRCHIREEGGGASTVSSSDTISLVGSGNVNTVLEFKLDAALNVDPARIDKYTCNMSIISGGQLIGTPIGAEDSDCIHQWEANKTRCGAPGTITRGLIEGPIP